MAARREQALTPENRDMGDGQQETDWNAGTPVGCLQAEKSLPDREARGVYSFLTASSGVGNGSEWHTQWLALDASATHHRADWEDLTPGVAFTSFDRVSEG
jgi:hypothetical protein